MKRNQLKMSRRALEDLSGVSASHIERLERGRSTNPTREVIHGLAHALNVTDEWLLRGEIASTPSEDEMPDAWREFLRHPRGRTSTPEERERIYSLSVPIEGKRPPRVDFLVAVLALLRNEIEPVELEPASEFTAQYRRRPLIKQRRDK